MTPVPDWVGPTIAISLAIIALAAVVAGAVTVAIGLGLRRRTRDLARQLGTVTGDARALAARLRGEVEGFADLSGDARARLRGALSTVQQRLEDLDALAEVVQEEVEETALGAAVLMRSVRRSGRVLGVARRALSRRRRDGGKG